MSKKAVIFGASTAGEWAYETYSESYNFIAFCDNDRAKAGTLFCGLPVVSPDGLSEYKNAEIIIASSYHLEIITQLTGMGYRRFLCFNCKPKHPEIHVVDLGKWDDFSVQKNKVVLKNRYMSKTRENTYALLKRRESYKTRLNFVLINTGDPEMDWGEYYYHMLTAGTIVYTFASLGHTPSGGKLNIQIWHGMSIKVQGYMRSNAFPVTFKAKEQIHLLWNKYNRIFATSQMEIVKMSAQYGLPIQKFALTGQARNDYLFDSDGRAKLALLLNREITQKTVLYAPTFRESKLGKLHWGTPGSFIFNSDDFNAESFNSFLLENNILLCIKLHPNEAEQVANIFDNSNIFAIDEEMIDRLGLHTYEIFNGFDLLITDYSSIYTDFLLLDTPMIFAPLDLEKMREEKELLFEPYEFWVPGPIVRTVRELETEIIKSLSDRNYYKKEREIIRNIFHLYKEKGFCERTVRMLEKEIDEYYGLDGQGGEITG